MRLERFLVAGIIGLFVVTPASASLILPPAVDPGVIQQRQIETERLRRELEQQQRQIVEEPVQQEPVPEPAPLTREEALAVRFIVNEIRFSDSEVFLDEELVAMASEFQGREVDLAELRKLVVIVDEAYRAKGVVTAKALIPAQDISEGIVHITLVEGRLGKVSVEGNDSTRTRYVINRVGLKSNDFMDIGKLEAALIRFNRTNDSQLRAELKPGEQFATTDLRVLMTEPPRHELRLTLDNMGSEATGVGRLGITYLNRSVLGFRDDASVSYTRAGGQDSRAATYAFPVNTYGGRVNLGYFKDATSIKYGDLSSLNVTGESASSLLAFRQPALINSTMQIDVVGGIKRRKVINWIDGVLLDSTKTSDRNLGVEGQLFGPQSSFFASYARAHGRAQTTDRRSYKVDRGSLRYQRSLENIEILGRFGTGLAVRSSLGWQLGKETALPSSEQFFIGGEGSVRGYPVGVYSGDTGQSLNLELHHPLLLASAQTRDIAASGFFFVDYGRVRPYRPANSQLSSHESLTGIGWGVNSTLKKNYFGRLTFGYGLNNVPQQPRHYQITLQLVASVL